MKQASLDMALEKVLGGGFDDVKDSAKELDDNDDDEQRINLSSKKGIPTI